MTHESVAQAPGASAADPANEEVTDLQPGAQRSPSAVPSASKSSAPEVRHHEAKPIEVAQPERLPEALQSRAGVPEITSISPPVSLRTLLDDARGRGEALGYRAALETALLTADALIQISAQEPMTDLSPASIAVTTGGGLRLISAHPSPSTNEIYAYQAPEQVKGMPVDVRANLFALGAIVFEILIGRPLFLRDDPATTMTAVIAGRLPDMKVVLSDVPAPFVNILLRLLSRPVEDRYLGPSELLLDLQIIRMPSGTHAPPSLSMLAASSARGLRASDVGRLSSTIDHAADDGRRLPGMWGDTASMFSPSTSEDTVREALRSDDLSWDGVLSVALVSAVVVGLAVFWFLTLT